MDYQSAAKSFQLLSPAPPDRVPGFRLQIGSSSPSPGNCLSVLRVYRVDGTLQMRIRR